MTTPDNTTDNQQHPTPTPDAEFSLPIEEAAALFMEAGVARSPRTISRYCENGYLDCTKIDTDRNVKYLISPASLELRIKELQSIITASRTQSHLANDGHNWTQQDRLNQLDTTRYQDTDENQQRLQKLELENHEFKILHERDVTYIERLEKQNDSLFQIVSSVNDKFFATVNMMQKMFQLQAPQPQAPPAAQPEPLDVPHQVPESAAVPPTQFSESTPHDENTLSLNQS